MKKRAIVVTILVLVLVSLAITATGTCTHNYVLDHTWVVGYVDGGDVCERWLGIALKCTYCGDMHYTQGVEHIPHNDTFLGSYLTSIGYINHQYCGRYIIREYECSNCGHDHSETEVYDYQLHYVDEWHVEYSEIEGRYIFYGDCEYCGTTIYD